MVRQTVTIGGEEVEVRETDDGFEAVPTGSNRKITFNSVIGGHVTINGHHDFEVAFAPNGSKHNLIAGFDEESIIEGSPNYGNDRQLSENWERNYYFDEIDAEEV